MEWILFTCLAALFFASGNFLDKFIVEKQVQGSWDYVFSYGLVAWVFVLVLLILVGLPRLDVNFLLGLFSGFLVALTGFFFARALKVTETSKIVILFQVIPLVSVFAGWIFLGQSLSPVAWVAFTLILIGSSITLLEKEGITFSKGAIDILLFSTIWSLIFVITDHLLVYMSFWEYLLTQTIGLGLSNFLFLVVPSIRSEVQTTWNKNFRKYINMTLVHSIDFLGKVSIVYAITIASYVGLVTVILQIQSLFSVAIGAILTILFPSLYKEDLSSRNITQKLIGALVIFAGILILFI